MLAEICWIVRIGGRMDLAAELDPERTGANFGYPWLLLNIWKIPGSQMFAKSACNLLILGSTIYLLLNYSWPWKLVWLAATLLFGLYGTKWNAADRRKRDNQYQEPLLYAYYANYFKNFSKRINRARKRLEEISPVSALMDLSDEE